MSARGLPPVGPDWQTWARQLGAHLTRFTSRLQWQTGEESAAENGVMMWDEAAGYPVVSRDGVFHEALLAGGRGAFSRTTGQAAGVVNTATAVVWDTSAAADGAALGTPASRVVVDDAGSYLVAFSFQLLSSNANEEIAWFWQRINGADVGGSVAKLGVNDNGRSLGGSLTWIRPMAAGDYIEIMFAVDDLGLSLDAPAATAFAPACPAATLTLTRISA